MEGCLLCLELKQEVIGAIFINSDQWHELNIEFVLNKYLWSMNHFTADSWICTACWTELYGFHKFYMRIEKAHSDLEFLTTKGAEVEKITLNNEEPTDNEKSKTPVNGLEEKPIEIMVKTTGAGLKDFLFESDFSQIDDREDQKPLLKIELEEELLADNSPLVQKRKRGRPRRDPFNNAKTTLNKTKKLKKCKVPDVGREADITTCSLNKTGKQQSKSKQIPLKRIEVVTENPMRHASENTCLTLDRDSSFSNDSEEESSKQLEVNSSTDICPPKIIRNERDKFLAKNFKMTCFLCDVPLETFYYMRKHFEEHHKVRGYIQCCNKKFYRRSNLIDHVHYHLNPHYFKCNKCDKVMEDRRRLDLHIKTHEINSGKNYCCDICGKGFLILGVLNKHKMTHLEEKTLKCSECDKKFATNYLLNSHYRYTHLKKYVKICDTCGKSIRNKDVFKRHMLQHEGKIARIGCDVCGLLLTDNKALKRHKDVIHPVGGQKQYTCSICSKTSPNLRAHKLHVQFKHEMGYNHKCTICDKAFKKSSSLKEHMASHTGTILYTCPWCPKTFNSNANMHHHRKRVHPKEWEETSRKRYSGKLPPYFKPPITAEAADVAVPLGT